MERRSLLKGLSTSQRNFLRLRLLRNIALKLTFKTPSLTITFFSELVHIHSIEIRLVFPQLS